MEWARLCMCAFKHAGEHELIYCSPGIGKAQEFIRAAAQESSRRELRRSQVLPGGWAAGPVGSAAVDVHGMFANSLIRSSGVKAVQPSARADPWPFSYF